MLLICIARLYIVNICIVWFVYFLYRKNACTQLWPSKGVFNSTSHLFPMGFFLRRSQVHRIVANFKKPWHKWRSPTLWQFLWVVWGGERSCWWILAWRVLWSCSWEFKYFLFCKLNELFWSSSGRVYIGKREREKGMTLKQFIAWLLQTCSETCFENMLDCLKLPLNRCFFLCDVFVRF